jgi:hypothetical protein
VRQRHIDIGDPQTRAGQQAELTGPARDIHDAREHSDNAKAFKAALAEHGIDLAQATRSDAVQSQLDSAEAKTRGKWKPTFREGEIGAVTKYGQVWKLTERTTGDKDIQKFLKGLDAPLPSIQVCSSRNSASGKNKNGKDPPLYRPARSVAGFSLIKYGRYAGRRCRRSNSANSSAGNRRTAAARGSPEINRRNQPTALFDGPGLPPPGSADAGMEISRRTQARPGKRLASGA